MGKKGKLKAYCCYDFNLDILSTLKIKNNIDTSFCQKPCSGLMVTSFLKSSSVTDLETIFPVLETYNNYKGKTLHPSGYNGKHIRYLSAKQTCRS